MIEITILTRKSLLLAFFSVVSIFANDVNSDLLEGVKSKIKLVNDLKDIYRAFNINHKITDQKEMINLNNDSKIEQVDLLTEYIRVCDNLRQTHFFNDTLNTIESKYLTDTKENYTIAKNNGCNSKAFKSNYKKYESDTKRYLDYLGKAYPMERFVIMTEDNYWKMNDKKNYIKSPDYATYIKLRSTDLKKAVGLLEEVSKKTANFQELSIYQIEIADEYVKHGTEFVDDADKSAVAKYKAILDQKKYSIYLFEAWLKWRTVSQQNNGLSHSSDIPNNEYDKIREQVALTILSHISDNQNDKMAINEFLLIATHDIVRRFGSYPYGNQNTIEYHEMFDDKK